MATAKEIETNIRNKVYKTEGSARATVTRADLSPAATARLHELVKTEYAGSGIPVHLSRHDIGQLANGNGGGHEPVSALSNAATENMLSQLAIRLCVYAGRTGITYDNAVTQLRARVKTLGIDG